MSQNLNAYILFIAVFEEENTSKISHPPSWKVVEADMLTVPAVRTSNGWVISGAGIHDTIDPHEWTIFLHKDREVNMNDTYFATDKFKIPCLWLLHKN